MYKYYICVIMTKDMVKNIINEEPVFTNGHIKDPKIYKKLEDHLGQPVIALRQSTACENEILIMAADGIVQTNHITKKRTAIINGTLDDIKVILTDIIAERTDEPSTVFHNYSYGCPMPEQLLLSDWFTTWYVDQKDPNTYTPASD